MNLLHFLHSYSNDLAISIGIIHINHQQRSESKIEEAYIKDWAQKHKLPCYVSYFEGVFTEAKGREFRYQEFKRIMSEYHYSALVTAHHADDQAETILMRFIRGSRLRQLTGIKAIQPFGQGELIRPFLSFKKSELPDIFHFEDYSNQTDDYFRNRIRNTVIPQLENENPKFKETMIQFGKESDLLLQALEQLTKTIDYLNLSIFRSQTYPVQYTLLQQYLTNFPDLQIKKSQFEQLITLINQKHNFHKTIKENYQLIIDYQTFKIEKIQPKTYIVDDNQVLQYDSHQFFKNYHFSFNKNTENAYITLYSTNDIILRSRRPGDVIDFGSFQKKLRRLFIDNKFTNKERGESIIAEQDGKIIFVLIGDKTYLRKANEDDIMKAKLYIEKIEKR